MLIFHVFRRRKAAERQKQLLEEFASKQKKFLESAGNKNIHRKDYW